MGVTLSRKKRSCICILGNDKSQCANNRHLQSVRKLTLVRVIALRCELKLEFKLEFIKTELA